MPLSSKQRAMNMKMKKTIKSLVATLVLLNLAPAFSQEELHIFGFFQSTFQYTPSTFEFSNPEFGIDAELDLESKSFLMQQMNMFFRKDLSSDFNMWVNLQFTNTFSTNHRWGTFNVEEAWIRYRHSNLFSLKAGLLIPRFNNLNEVKNRMPYLPYVLRPFIYEATYSEVVGDLENYVPHRAFLQGYGEIELGHSLALDYALYLGDSEADFFATEDTEFAFQSGVDTTMNFLLGGRLGLKTSSFKIGTSLTLDKDNLAAFELGSVRRTRIGGDLSFTVSRFSFESEIIAVKHESVANVELDKLFYYLTLQYDFTDKFFGYMFHSRVRDDFDPVSKNGISAYSPGVGYRVMDTIVIKAQYIKTILDDGSLPPTEEFPIPLDFEFDINFFSMAVSIFF